MARKEEIIAKGESIMSKMAEKRALEAYPINVSKASVEAGFDWNEEYRDVFMEGYNQAMKDIMEKACEWMEKNARNARDYVWYDETMCGAGVTDKFINDFKQAMEE